MIRKSRALVYDERIRRWVDAELDADEVEALEAEAASRPHVARAMEAARDSRDALAELRSELDVTPPEDLVDRAVRHAVRRKIEQEEALASSWWHWFWQPRELRVRVSPLSALGTLAIATTGVALLLQLASGRQAELRAYEGEVQAATSRAVERIETVVREDMMVPVRFVLPTEGADSVAVAGDFNEWQPDANFLQDEDGDGVFVGTLRVPPGTYTYAFVVDGEEWLADPFASNYRDDDFGTRNAVLRID